VEFDVHCIRRFFAIPSCPFRIDLSTNKGTETRGRFNFAPLALWRSHDAEDRQGITEIQHVTGYLAYWDELRRRFPNLLIDTCASGGRRLDLETLRRSVRLWRSDFTYEPSAMQQFTYGLSLWIPYFGTCFNSTDPYVSWSQMTGCSDWWVNGVRSRLCTTEIFIRSLRIARRPRRGWRRSSAMRRAGGE
jgi:hypothetical protein